MSTPTQSSPENRPPPSSRPQPASPNPPIARSALSSGIFIRALFLLEAVFNLLGAFTMILYPNATLRLFVPKPYIVTTTSASLLQWLGALVLGLTPPLVLALPEGRGQVQRRKWVYQVLGFGKAGLVPVLVWQAVGEGKGSGLERWVLGVAALFLGSLIGWRVWVLGWREEWFGSENGEEERERNHDKKNK